ncbi:GNAT family N-acetyltransferase [Gammaproteobacteria bacterium]|nr:GNAT family N-acetyltransferase [Gammaproteobacteria bacterium]
MQQPLVHEAKIADKKKILSTACLAFGSDPFTRWIMPEAQSYLDNYQDLVDIYCCEKSLQESTTFVIEGCSGAAIWLPPGVFGDTQEISGWISQNVREQRIETLEKVLDELDKYHPKTNRCWYLALLAVDPALQGIGLGSIMMMHVNRLLDNTGSQGYLESSNAKNISLYQRHGYEVMGEIKVGDCPVVTPMLREPM